MTLLFKIIGFALIITTTSLLGLIKANNLNLRCKKLKNIKASMLDLKQRIRLSHLEIDKLIELSFKGTPDYSNLEKNDCQIIKEFFQDIGMSDCDGECERCKLYINLLDRQINEAEKSYYELNKLYKYIGFLSGVFICIFFL